MFSLKGHKKIANISILLWAIATVAVALWAGGVLKAGFYLVQIYFVLMAVMGILVLSYCIRRMLKDPQRKQKIFWQKWMRRFLFFALIVMAVNLSRFKKDGILSLILFSLFFGGVFSVLPYYFDRRGL